MNPLSEHYAIQWTDADIACAKQLRVQASREVDWYSALANELRQHMPLQCRDMLKHHKRVVKVLTRILDYMIGNAATIPHDKELASLTHHMLGLISHGPLSLHCATDAQCLRTAPT